MYRKSDQMKNETSMNQFEIVDNTIAYLINNFHL